MQPKDSKDTKSDPVQDAWNLRTALWEQAAQTQGLVDPGKIDPADIKVELGPPMTAEQFEAWMAKRKNMMKNFSKQ